MLQRVDFVNFVWQRRIVGILELARLRLAVQLYLCVHGTLVLLEITSAILSGMAAWQLQVGLADQWLN